MLARYTSEANTVFNPVGSLKNMDKSKGERECEVCLRVKQFSANGKSYIEVNWRWRYQG